MSVTEDPKTVLAEIKHKDGTTSVIPIDPSAILYNEEGTRPIGVVTSSADIGDDFVKIKSIDISKK